MSLQRVALAGAAGYLLGTIPSADLATRLASRSDVDLRVTGSGNPGAANAAKVLGNRWGAAVLVADLAKGVAAGFAGRAVAGDLGAYAAATAAVAGHIAPVWNGFRGGKGIATSAGTCLAVFPAYFGFDLAVAAIGAAGSRNAERATQLSAVGFTTAATVWWLADLPNRWGPRPSAALPAFAAATSAMILAKFATARRTARP
ncbi:MAG: plsY [Actinomycetia bacterium]|nr:plsY [Actinomycetes bacterium]